MIDQIRSLQDNDDGTRHTKSEIWKAKVRLCALNWVLQMQPLSHEKIGYMEYKSDYM